MIKRLELYCRSTIIAEPKSAVSVSVLLEEGTYPSVLRLPGRIIFLHCTVILSLRPLDARIASVVLLAMRSRARWYAEHSHFFEVAQFVCSWNMVIAGVSLASLVLMVTKPFQSRKFYKIPQGGKDVTTPKRA